MASGLPLGPAGIVGVLLVAGAIALAEGGRFGDADAGSDAAGQGAVQPGPLAAGQPGGEGQAGEEPDESPEQGEDAEPATEEELGSEEAAARAAVEDYLTALVDGDSEGACELLSDEATRQVAELAQAEPGLARDCEAVIDLALSSVSEDQRARLLDTEITRVEVSGSMATIEFEGATAPVPLERTDEGWRIAQFEGATGAP